MAHAADVSAGGYVGYHTRFDVDLAQAVRLTFEPLDSWSHSTDRAAHGAAGEVR
jgi:hypothetical protein